MKGASKMQDRLPGVSVRASQVLLFSSGGTAWDSLGLQSQVGIVFHLRVAERRHELDVNVSCSAHVVAPRLTFGFASFPGTEVPGYHKSPLRGYKNGHSPDL